jgi:hypothetical protein
MASSLQIGWNDTSELSVIILILGCGAWMLRDKVFVLSANPI